MYANICNPKYIQKYAFENMQKKYKKICKKYAKRCIDPTSIDLMKKKSKNIQEICKKYE